MKWSALAFLFTAVFSTASTTIPLSEEAEWSGADAVCRGRVESVQALEISAGGGIMTRAVIVVGESFRGRLPERIAVDIRGGSVEGRGEDFGDSPGLRAGQERLFYLAKTKDGKALTLLRGSVGAKRIGRGRGGELTLDEALRQRRLKRWQREKKSAEADLTAMAAAPAAGGAQQAAADGDGSSPGTGGLLTDVVTGIPARWTAPDRGEPIPYLVDATVLPLGMTVEQAMTALQNAFAAWTAVTGIQFRFEGFSDFQMASPNVLLQDEKIRVQFHDTHGYIESVSTLAIGGRAWSSVDSSFNAFGGGGGQVNGVEFHKAVRGYVVVRHTAPSMENLKTLEETLCHELGHVLGLAHSSENPTEPSPTLQDAMMYYRVHQDDRGATLSSYDPPVVRKAHTAADTPPWAFPRYMTAHTGTAAQTAPGVNEYTLSGHDLQTPAASLTMVTGPAVGSQGTFAFTGSKVTYSPASNYPDGGIADPASATYGKIFYRYSDGVNCSPWQPVSVIAYRRDTVPANGDGLPDSWMVTHFTNKDPALGLKRGPNDDFDGDGLTNLEEYRLGTNPTRGQSRFNMTVLPGGVLQWLARPWGLYLLENSVDGVNWNYMQGVVPKTAGGSVTAPLDPEMDRRFLRLRYIQ